MGARPGQASPFEVLVADDDPDIRDLLGEFLRDRSLRMSSVQDGRAAITTLERSDGRYALVITDIAMPGADGFAVLAAARQANPESYVVVMTGFATLETAIQAVRLGAQDYLTKPFALGQIGIILDRALARFAEVNNRSRGASDNGAQERVNSQISALSTRLTSIEQTLAELLTLVRDRSKP